MFCIVISKGVPLFQCFLAPLLCNARMIIHHQTKRLIGNVQLSLLWLQNQHNRIQLNVDLVESDYYLVHLRSIVTFLCDWNTLSDTMQSCHFKCPF